MCCKVKQSDIGKCCYYDCLGNVNLFLDLVHVHFDANFNE